MTTTNDQGDELDLEATRARQLELAHELRELLAELAELARLGRLALDQVELELGGDLVCSSCGAHGHSRCLT